MMAGMWEHPVGLECSGPSQEIMYNEYNVSRATSIM